MRSLITCVVAGLQYLIHPQKLGSIQETINPDSIIPVTLLTTGEIFGDPDAVLKLFDFFDDVFIPEFGSVLVEKPEDTGNESNFSSILESGFVKDIFRLADVDVVGTSDWAALPSGPYFLHGPNLHQAWRLYDDHLGAFTFGVIPEDVNKRDEYRPLNALSSSGLEKSIPVPSRLYHPPTSSARPLSGIRISLTDIISLNGAQTTFSSRAWSSLYGSAATATAEFAQRLIDLGAVIVGKTKTAQFGIGEHWIDELAPFSPRADGYQHVMGGSAGSDASLTGYEWLNHAVGSEDFVTVKSSELGLYSFKPSPSSISDEGLVITSQYDNLRLSSRSIDGLMQMASASIGKDSFPTKLQNHLIYLLDFEEGMPEDEKALLLRFIAALENSLGVKTEMVTIENRWRENPPKGSNGDSIWTYMGKAPFLSWSYQHYHAFDKFRDDYEKKFHRTPYVEPVPETVWDYGKNVTKAEQDAYLQRVETFRGWFDENVMDTRREGASDTVLILPCKPSEPMYRDQPVDHNEGTKSTLLSAILNVPRLTVPFAQLPFESRVSGQTEYNPVCASLVGAQGSDLSLIRLVKNALELAQWRTRVDTGHLAFPLGDNERNVNDEHHQQSVLQAQTRPDEL